jgi:O-antigen/teichoic acid export membrane protein
MLARKVAYNTAVQIFGKIIGFFISGTLLVIVSEHLGTYNMGNYVTIIAFVGFFVSLSDLGANLLLVRDIAQNEADKERITGEYFGFRLTFSLLVMLLGPLVALLIPQYGPLIIKGSIIITAAQFILLVNQMFISMLQTRLMLDRGVLAELVNRLVTLGAVIAAVRLGWTGTNFFFAVLYATLLGSVVNLLISFAFARRLWLVRPVFTLESWKRTLVTIAPIGLFTFLGMIHFKADTIMLSLIKSPHEVGVYGYAYKIGEIIFTFPVMFIGAIFPRLSQLLTENREKFRQLAQLAFDALLVATIPFLTFIFLGARHFTVLLSRSNYQDGLAAGNALQILTVAMAAWFIGTLFIHLLIMANDYKGLIRNLTIVVVINVLLNIVLIPTFSYYGAAIVTVITELLMLALTVAYTKKTLDFRPKINYWGSTVVATAAMAVIAYWLLTTSTFNLAGYATASRLHQMATITGLAVVCFSLFTLVFWPMGGRSLVRNFRNKGV